MARVSLKKPWWRRMLRRWWKVESVCCLWARPHATKVAYECGWCGRLNWLRDLDEPIWGTPPMQEVMKQLGREMVRATIATRRFSKVLEEVSGD